MVFLPVQEATPRGLLSPPLRRLAAQLAPHQILVDCGGQGQCGPNSLAFLLGRLGLFEGDGVELSQKVTSLLSSEMARANLTPFQWRSDPGSALNIGKLMVESLKAWPEEFRQGKEPSVSAWCDIIRRPDAWTDIAFVMGCVQL